MSKPSKVWLFKKPDDWLKQVQALPHEVQKKLASVLETMAFSPDPRRHGKLKYTKYGVAFVAELDRSYRLAYRVSFQACHVVIVRVGDHKQVYGRGS